MKGSLFGCAILVAAALATAGASAQRVPSPLEDEPEERGPPLTLPEGSSGEIRRGREPADGPRQVESIRGVFQAIRACWRAHPEPGGPTGQQATIRISFKRNGEVVGPPRITYTKLAADREVQERFLASVLASFRHCVPLPFSESFGGAIAGRPFTLRFVDDRPT